MEGARRVAAGEAAPGQPRRAEHCSPGSGLPGSSRRRASAPAGAERGPSAWRAQSPGPEAEVGRRARSAPRLCPELELSAGCAGPAQAGAPGSEGALASPELAAASRPTAATGPAMLAGYAGCQLGAWSLRPPAGQVSRACLEAGRAVGALQQRRAEARVLWQQLDGPTGEAAIELEQSHVQACALGEKATATLTSTDAATVSAAQLQPDVAMPQAPRDQPATPSTLVATMPHATCKAAPGMRLQPKLLSSRMVEQVDTCISTGAMQPEQMLQCPLRERCRPKALGPAQTAWHHSPRGDRGNPVSPLVVSRVWGETTSCRPVSSPSSPCLVALHPQAVQPQRGHNKALTLRARDALVASSRCREVAPLPLQHSHTSLPSDVEVREAGGCATPSMCSWPKAASPCSGGLSSSEWCHADSDEASPGLATPWSPVPLSPSRRSSADGAAEALAASGRPAGPARGQLPGPACCGTWPRPWPGGAAHARGSAGRPCGAESPAPSPRLGSPSSARRLPPQQALALAAKAARGSRQCDAPALAMRSEGALLSSLGLLSPQQQPARTAHDSSLQAARRRPCQRNSFGDASSSSSTLRIADLPPGEGVACTSSASVRQAEVVTVQQEAQLCPSLPRPTRVPSPPATPRPCAPLVTPGSLSSLATPPQLVEPAPRAHPRAVGSAAAPLTQSAVGQRSSRDLGRSSGNGRGRGVLACARRVAAAAAQVPRSSLQPSAVHEAGPGPGPSSAAPAQARQPRSPTGLASSSASGAQALADAAPLGHDRSPRRSWRASAGGSQQLPSPAKSCGLAPGREGPGRLSSSGRNLQRKLAALEWSDLVSL